MDFSIYIVSVELFRVYKRFSISNRCNKPYQTPEDARNYMHSLVDILDLKNIYDAVYVDVYSENKIVVYVDDGIDKHTMYMIVTVNKCESSDNKKFKYRQHVIEMTPEGWIISMDDAGPVTLMESLDSALDFIDCILVTRDNVIRVTGDFMMNTPVANGKIVS